MYLFKVTSIATVHVSFPAAVIYLFKVNNGNTRTMCENCLVNNKGARATSLTSFWGLYCYLWTDFINCSGIPIVDGEQVNAVWVEAHNLYRTYHVTFKHDLNGLYAIKLVHWLQNWNLAQMNLNNGGIIFGKWFDIIKYELRLY